jgi:sirohydrochlorin ferrochelatase
MAWYTSPAIAAALEPLLDFSPAVPGFLVFPRGDLPRHLPFKALALQLIPGPGGSLDYDKIALRLHGIDGTVMREVRYLDYARYPATNRGGVMGAEQSWRMLAAYLQVAQGLMKDNPNALLDAVCAELSYPEECVG